MARLLRAGRGFRRFERWLAGVHDRTPRDEGKEWQLLTNVVGRLADRYAGMVESINIQLTKAPEPTAKRKKRRRWI